jgi:hypothetical protein
MPVQVCQFRAWENACNLLRSGPRSYECDDVARMCHRVVGHGPKYTLPEHLERLRERGLSGKRSPALREFALGIEGLERF